MKKMKVTYNSPVVLTFALVSFLTLLLNYITAGHSNALLFCTYRDSLSNPLMYIRLFTHVLGHGDFNHYISNMLLFLLLGPMLEEKYGSKNLLKAIVLTAFITGVLNSLFSPYGLLGASGVVFCFIVLSSMTAFREGEIPLTFIIVLIMYLGQEIVAGIFLRDNVSQITHLIGGLSGAMIGFSFHRTGK